ncbi:MAG: trypsin-like peptidase domain-containing protein, partial [Clostridia bacterium]|nr:trypsin-like peptidase domain-containing protein [Clostridia bacterium]
MDDLENRNDEMNGVDQPYQTPDNDGSVSREPVADDIPGTVNESVPPENYSDPASASGGSYPYSDSGNSAGGQASLPYGPKDPSNGGYPYGPNGANNGGYPYGSNGGYGGSYNGGGQRQSGNGSYPYGSYAPKQPAGNGKPPKAPKKKTGAGTVVLVVLLCVALIVAGIGVTAAILSGKRNGSGGNSENSGIHEEIETKAGVSEGPSLNINDTPSAPASSGDVLSATDIYNKVCDSSVGILVYEAKSTSVSSEGSGVVMAIEDGRTYIVTCAHVIDTAGAEIYVTPYDSETKFKAEVIGYDVRTDLGVISIESTDFTAAEFGDVSGLLVGQTVYAIGNPGGLEFMGSVSTGIVSGLNRSLYTENGIEMNLIQTDAAINPGNS